MMLYPVNPVCEGLKFLVFFPDFPNVHTFGDEEEARVRAVDALMLMAMIEDRKDIP